jgi:hypothetical protein
MRYRVMRSGELGDEEEVLDTTSFRKALHAAIKEAAPDDPEKEGASGEYVWIEASWHDKKYNEWVLQNRWRVAFDELED